MNVLKRHEARYLWQHRSSDGAAQAKRGTWRGVDAEVIWYAKIPKTKTGAIPLIFELVVREERRWIQKGTKLYFDRALAIRKESGKTVLEKNDERLCPIGYDNYEFWTGDLQ